MDNDSIDWGNVDYSRFRSKRSNYPYYVTQGRAEDALGVYFPVTIINDRVMLRTFRHYYPNRYKNQIVYSAHIELNFASNRNPLTMAGGMKSSESEAIKDAILSFQELTQTINFKWEGFKKFVFNTEDGKEEINLNGFFDGYSDE